MIANNLLVCVCVWNFPRWKYYRQRNRDSWFHHCQMRLTIQNWRLYICEALSDIWHLFELLIIKIHNPSIIIIIIICRPLSCTAMLFNDIIDKCMNCISNISSTLPNIVMLGDFNMPGVSWSNPSCSLSSTLVNLIVYFWLSRPVIPPVKQIY